MQGGSYWTGAQRREARSILAFFPLELPSISIGQKKHDAKPPYFLLLDSFHSRLLLLFGL